jgi:hypothetical protein
LKTYLAVVTGALLAVGCGGVSNEAGSDPGVGGSTLTISADGTQVRGTFTTGGKEVVFRSIERDNKVFEIQVVLQGMTLDALLDVTNGVSSLDGFAADSGADTQMLDEDRAALEALYKYLNAELPTDGVTDSARYLRRTVGLWAQNPTSVELKRVVAGEEGRGYTMLCSYAKCGGAFTGGCSSYNWYSYAKHDCQHGGFDLAINQQIAQLGDHYSCSGDEYYSTTGASWTCGEPDHWSRPKVVGNCFGRCGGGCGGDTQYTLDATNHDGCVRNGHALASLYCDDQFTSASDDELFAPNCY